MENAMDCTISSSATSVRSLLKFISVVLYTAFQFQSEPVMSPMVGTRSVSVIPSTVEPLNSYPSTFIPS